MNSIRVVAFYTIDTPYQQEVELLRASLLENGVKHHIAGYPSRGDWVSNCGIKPEFLADMLKLFPTDNILYIDADATVTGSLDYFRELEADIGVHYKDGKELLSGTIFLKNTERARQLVGLWVEAQKNSPTVWDQRILANVLAKYFMIGPLTIANIPAIYCKIFDKDMGIGDATPVITHNQASRRFKEAVNMPEDKFVHTFKDVPTELYGMRIRRAADGTIWIPRNNKQVTGYLDLRYTRVPGTLRWYPNSEGSQLFGSEREYFERRGCYLVGKGPSLDELSTADFSNSKWPIIAMNDAIHKVESLNLPNPVYGAQQDTSLQGTCRPAKGKLFVAYQSRHFYSDFKDKIIFHPVDLEMSSSSLTVLCAIRIAKKLGVKQFTMLCFDACVNQETAYARCIGYAPDHHGGSPNRFLAHRAKIDAELGGMSTIWLTPKLPVSRVDDIPQQSQCSPEENRAPVPSES